MHNWARIYYLEKHDSTKFNYKGFIVKRNVSIYFFFKFNVLGNFWSYKVFLWHIFQTNWWVFNRNKPRV